MLGNTSDGHSLPPGYLILVDLCAYHTKRIYTDRIMQKVFSYTSGTFFKHGNKSPLKEYYLKYYLSVAFKVLMYKIICSTRKSTFHTFPLLLKCWTLNFFSSVLLSSHAMLLWLKSYCSFKPALRDRESDMWHQYSLTIPLAHERKSWILGSQYHCRTTAAVMHTATARSRGAWKAVWGLV